MIENECCFQSIDFWLFKVFYRDFLGTITVFQPQSHAIIDSRGPFFVISSEKGLENKKSLYIHMKRLLHVSHSNPAGTALNAFSTDFISKQNSHSSSQYFSET
jgi:hypothetical protein